MREHHRGDAVRFEVQISTASEKQSCYILVGSVAPTGPDFVDGFALALEFGADYGFGAVVGEPGRVADDYVDLGLRQSNRPHQIACVVHPNVVSPLIAQLDQSFDRAIQCFALGPRLWNVCVVQRQRRILTSLDRRSEPRHEPVEPIRLFNECARKIQCSISLQVIGRVLFNRNRDVLTGEHVPRLGAQLERVTEVDRHCYVDFSAAGAFESFAGGEGPGGAGEVDGGGVYVDACDVGEQSVEHAGGFAARGAGGGEILANGGEDERAGAASGVEHALVERIGDDGVDDFAGEPVGSVILAKSASVVGGDDGFVEDAGDIGLGAGPIEAVDAAGESAQPCAALDFGGPGEEVGLDDAAHAGFVNE